MLRENTTQTIYTILPLTMLGGICDKFVDSLFFSEGGGGDRQAQCLSIYFIAIQRWKFVIFFYMSMYVLIRRHVLVLRYNIRIYMVFGFYCFKRFCLEFRFYVYIFSSSSYCFFVLFSCHFVISLKIGLFAQSLLHWF